MIVLDASAFLAYIQDEPGAGLVGEALMSGAVMNLLNYAEVLTRVADSGVSPAEFDRQWRDQGLIGQLLELVPLVTGDAIQAAELRASTRSRGLSLGDRICLATGLRLDLPILTADRVWLDLSVGVTIRLIRS